MWNSPGNATASDEVKTFASVGVAAPTHYLKATGFGFSLPASAVIRGIEVTVERNSAFGLVTDNAVRIVKGGTVGASDRSNVTPWPTPPDAIATYGSSSDLWGLTWTAADINGAGFGAAVSAKDGVSGDLAQVDHLTITVSYSLCGDSIVSPGEACDDGNTSNGDCCSSTCQFESSSVVCRPAAGICDVAENCTGSSAPCPPDGFASSAVVCRASSPGQVCDETELCTGSGAACPPDGVKPDTAECRSSTDACDAAELCDGVTKICPSDVLEPSSVVCRAAVGECDVAENCTGSSSACPADVVVSAGTPCASDGNPCTADECNGAGACAHPPDPEVACELIPGKIVVVKPAKLAKFVAKSKPIAPATFPIPFPGSSDDPTLHGGTLRILDTSGGAGDVTYTLQSDGWKGLGNPPGSRGYKYKGKDAVPPDNTCKIVLVKAKVIKAVCKGTQVTLAPPFAGKAGIVLEVGTSSIRYCAEFGGQERKNDVKLLKRKNAPTPGQCSDVATATPTPTATATRTPTQTATATPTISPTRTSTPTTTPTATDSPTPANTPTNTASATATNTGGATATNTPPATNTPTATPSPTPTQTSAVVCPLVPGAYTLTQVAGGVLTVDGLPAFPFPAGGTIIQDVAAGNPSCVHSTVVPFPGGFSAPAFCIPALGFTTSVVQTGCGIGRIDSNGGSDFTITEIGDTSAPGAPCFLTHSCTSGANSNVRVDITIGNGAADTCAPPGTANATVSVPVFTTTWLKIGMCPDGDGMYTPGPDILVVSFPQTLDFTTDSTLGDWADLDPNGCCIAGAGPASFTNPCTPGGAGGLSATGTCLNVAGIGVAGVDTTTVAAGAVGSSGSPLYDLTFVTVLPNTATGPGAPLGAVCPSPPILTYGGTATRCIP